MFKILWFLLVAFTLTISLVWLLDHNGSVLIDWLGYELQTDILTAILLAVFCSLMVFSFSYLVARILAIRFPNLLKLLFKKSYVRSLEKVIKKHHKAFDTMSQLMLALEVNDEKSIQNQHKKFSKLIKNSALNNFFQGKIFFENADFSKAAEYFAKFGENKNAKILVLKAKFRLALKNQDDVRAIAYAKQILLFRSDSFEIVKILFSLYKKQGLWQDAKILISQYGSENFTDELQKRDLAVINCALSFEYYQQKKFLLAIKHAKIALKAENNFLPAFEILFKSWLKLGLNFKVRWKIKAMWRDNPHLILAEIFDLANRKSSAKNRITMMKKLAETNNESALGKLAAGVLAYRLGSYQMSKEFLNISLLREKTHRAYKFLALVEEKLGESDAAKKHFAKSEMLNAEDYYTCNSCNHNSSRWSAKCVKCNSHDSLEWNN